MIVNSNNNRNNNNNNDFQVNILRKLCVFCLWFIHVMVSQYTLCTCVEKQLFLRVKIQFDACYRRRCEQMPYKNIITYFKISSNKHCKFHCQHTENCPNKKCRKYVKRPPSFYLFITTINFDVQTFEICTYMFYYDII